MLKLKLKPGSLSLKSLRCVWLEPVTLSLNKQAWSAVEKSAAVVTKVISQNETVYGINTGFGILARERINDDDLENLQRKLVLSHAAGTGAPLNKEIVRLILLLKINSLTYGFSGVRPVLIQTLIGMLNHEIYPVIPSKGSVGASGDLAPLAHMSLALIGRGKVHYKGRVVTAKTAFKDVGLEHLRLGPKEGLALINGTQVSTALALDGLFKLENIFSAALVSGALSVDAAKGSVKPFDERVHQVRGQLGQIECAAVYRSLLKIVPLLSLT